MKFISVLLKENTKINICCFLLDFNFNIIEKNYNFVNNFNQTLIYITEKPPPLLRGSLAKIVTFGTKHLSAIQGMSAIWEIRHWEVSLYK